MMVYREKTAYNVECDDVGSEKCIRGRLTVKRPIHVNIGGLDIMGGGILYLTEQDVGTKKIFFDITLAELDGHFSLSPTIWGQQEYHCLLHTSDAADDLPTFEQHGCMRHHKQSIT